MVQTFFDAVLSRIKDGKHDEARELLASLKERNEFHLGLSKGKSRGHAFGDESAKSVWKALSKSKAAKSGLLRDIEDAALLIHGIGPDMISDAICNILRGPLIKYTQDICAYYDIKLTPDVDSGPVWHPQSESWKSELVSLPMTSSGKIILVPKLFVRYRVSYRPDQYYSGYLVPEMRADEIRRSSGLVELLKNGNLRVTKKSLEETYGSNKLALVEQTLRFPQALVRYRDEKTKNPSKPMSDQDLAKATNSSAADWTALKAELVAIQPGKAQSGAYELVIEKIFSALFVMNLCNPTKQHEIHDGRKRIDITYTNEARSGFFSYLAAHYPAAMIFVECKNYGKEVANPEFDQLAGRFSPSRGTFGMLVCRKVADPAKLIKSCRDTVSDQRGYIIVLTDDDVIELIDQAEKGDFEHQMLRKKFKEIIS